MGQWRGRVGSAVLGLALALVSGGTAEAAAARCVPTGMKRDGLDLTAALVNPSAPVSGDVDATGCHIGVYFDRGRGRVERAQIHGATYFGVAVNGDEHAVQVDVVDSSIHDIGERPMNGDQHGVAVYYSARGRGTASGEVRRNTLTRYQKGGVAVNGEGAAVDVLENTVEGLGPVDFIAQNGIQVGWGAYATVIHNTVRGHSYTGKSTVAAGVLVVGGPGYGGAYTVDTRIGRNRLEANDVGVYLQNLAAGGSAATEPTRIRVFRNAISNPTLTSGRRYQAGVSDLGNGDAIVGNVIRGAGYTPYAFKGAITVHIDANPAVTRDPKVHGNR